MHNSNPTIGINFSSRNRPELLALCLEQTKQFLSADKYRYIFAVVNDINSDAAFDEQYRAMAERFPEVHWYKSMEQRLGIAGAKNHGIKILANLGCDYFFLFDDDVFPAQTGWESLYIDTALRNGIHHMMHIFPLPSGFEIKRSENGVCEYDSCTGVMLFFSRHAIDTIGGYRKGFSFYGYEHAEISERCNFAGLQPGWGPFISPAETRSFFYSFDLDLNNWGVAPAIHYPPEIFRSSVQGEDIWSSIDHNATFMGKPTPVYEEI